MAYELETCGGFANSNLLLVFLKLTWELNFWCVRKFQINFNFNFNKFKRSVNPTTFEHVNSKLNIFER